MMTKTMTQSEKSALIARENDRCRRSMIQRARFKTVLTASVSALDDNTVTRLMLAVQSFDRFTPDNDPYNEHDFGAVIIDEERYLFKFDYYADDKFDKPGFPPAECVRVLTIMHENDY